VPEPAILRLWLFAAVALPCSSFNAAAVATTIEAEVCVYGASAGGVMAAVQASRMGKRVALVEPGLHLGGASVEGLGSTDIDNHGDFQNSLAVGGLAREFYRRISVRYGRSQRFDDMLASGAKEPALWKFESSIAEGVIEDLVTGAGVHVYRGHRLRQERGVARDDATRRITAIHCENGVTFTAAIFIDGTIEGDLLAAAGVSTVIGREANALYGETKNGIRGTNTYRQFEVPVDPYRVPGDVGSGLIATIQDEPLGTPGAGDHRIQGFCFRMCLTRDPANRLAFTKPANYRAEDYEIYRRYAAAGGKLWTPSANLPNGKTDLGSWHDLSANLYGLNHEYPGGTYAIRERIYQHHLTFTQGLCWFLANDSGVPESIRTEWSKWGVTRDEFTDNAGWPRMFYVREGRRMVSDYVITEAHTRRAGQRSVADPIALAFWPPDTHHVRRIVRDGKAYNEGFVFGGTDWAPFGVSYRALVPRAAECTNLITPTCPSSSHVAYGAIRLEWTFMAMGQAAGTAAALALDAGCEVQKVNYRELAARLLADGQVLAVERAGPGIVVENVSAVLTGEWVKSTNVAGYSGDDYHISAVESRASTARFVPDIPATGDYDVFLRWTAAENRAQRVPVEVKHADGTATLAVNQRERNGVWVKLGRWSFTKGKSGSLLLDSSDTTGRVVADAARWIKSGDTH
jgi:hypothetical protein